MPFPIIPALVITGISLLLKGCGREEKKGGESKEGKFCFHSPKGKPPDVEPNQSIITDGNGHYIVADEGADSTVINQYLDYFSEAENHILNLFGIDSPWNERLVAHFLKEENFVRHCPQNNTRACAGRWGNMFFQEAFSFPEAKGTFVHELSHALRKDVASPWWGIEEGLAVYSAYRINNEGFIENQICREDGFHLVYRNTGFEGPMHEYMRLESFERDDRAVDYYPTGFCFWETLREQYGDESVATIVQSMTEFSKHHEYQRKDSSDKEERYFPFFQTFMDVTGLEEQAAREYFDRFSAPTKDQWYPIGGVCW